MKIPYLQEREKFVQEYFAQLPNGNNITALWKKFWYVTINHSEWKVDSIVFKLLDNTEIQHELLTIQMNLPWFFSKYDTLWSSGAWGFPVVTIRPKERLEYIENLNITDSAKTRIVTEAQLKEMELNLF